MAETLDQKAVSNILSVVVEKTLSAMSGMPPSSPAETKEVDIDEYEGRMRVLSMHDFESSIYIAVTNLYASQEDMQRNRPKGTLILYLDTENTSKLYRALGFSFSDDEDDASMLETCGQFCKNLAQNLTHELVEKGYMDLAIGPAQHYKNSVLDGVEYPQGLNQKSQVSLFYWKRKALVAELVLANLPRKQ